MTKRKSIILALLLWLPVLAFVVHHYISYAPGLKPTGFTNTENVLYMSYAHQYIDAQHFSLFYSNPFDGDPASPKIYFQPVTLLFAVALKAGSDPGFVFSFFGLVMAFACIYVGVRMVNYLMKGSKYTPLVSLLFTWGGGLTALTGIAATIASGNVPGFDSIYPADPANGWWGMNWGRVLFIPLEAYYHFLFLLGIYCIIRRQWRRAAALAWFLSISHPFTGIEYLSIVCGWLMLEKLIYRNKSIPTGFIVSTALTILFHVGYYLVYLPQFAEHGELFSQYSAGWTYSFRVFIPAYFLVFLLSLASLKIKGSARNLLHDSPQRLFLCWAIIAFLLSKHEWFMRPMQPIHFTRGYIWAGLFLLGIPALIYIREKTAQGVKKIVYNLFILLFLFDNIAWVADQLRQRADSESETHLSVETVALFDYLEKNTSEQDLLMGQSVLIQYMANVYTSANAWFAHPYNTPHYAERIRQSLDAIANGHREAWGDRRILVIYDRTFPLKQIAGMITQHKLFENGRYVVYEWLPSAANITP